MDDFILHLAKALGASPSVPVLEQQLFGARPRPGQRGFEALGDGGAQFVLAPGMALGERFELGDNRLRIDQVAAGAV